ncbi:MAG: hypothetical protein WBX25_33035 [Rhodomicrobium sp.]
MFTWHESCRKPRVVRFFAALIFLLRAIAPASRPAKANQPPGISTDWYEAFGVTAEELKSSICHHDDDGTPDLPVGGQSRLCKEHCALLAALQHQPLGFASGSVAELPSLLIAAVTLVPDRAAPILNRDFASQRRPRAPPQAFILEPILLS